MAKEENSKRTDRFTIDTAGDCVIDNQTGLMWSKDANIWGRLDWQSALDKIKLLNQQSGLGGYTDWRLPTRKELESLLDFGNFKPALPTGHPFINVQSNNYWSSTTNACTATAAWFVNMYHGYTTHVNNSNSYSVWPVRSGQ